MRPEQVRLVRQWVEKAEENIISRRETEDAFDIVRRVRDVIRPQLTAILEQGPAGNPPADGDVRQD